ncbi:DNA cytosine methyltransferase [Proteiniclasticum sp. BAD-10]|uniref:DNA (cytosine-5-)-methyltransferase n=1 Tax=Proteiniclasticum sediminis TaxID=2804028 RepID=A0A941CSG8_9CLOT|nr:DNA cytosine methyltransferase [Proteiniclasticum sediminis]MBR0576769.1 DNA cytosine methyltransferase [Proteiniclasticum sediminis]
MGLIVDNFAGGGGASTGIELAIGRSVDIAINHDEMAIRMHSLNHPTTKHYCEDVWAVDPLEATQGQTVDLAWFSPDCKHFSKAKGGKPVEKKIRGLAWVVLKWAGKVKPKVIMLENVEEFKTWGPIKGGRPVAKKKGETYRMWKSQLESLGYKVESRELKACDYGAPTTRNRLFIVARCDGRQIVWPEATHGPKDTLEVQAGLLKPYREAWEIIYWSIPEESIFERKKQLSENTMKRIARGLQKFVIDERDPYILEDKLPYIIRYNTETANRGARGQTLRDPISTLDTSNRFGLVTAFISRQFGTSTGHDLRQPLATTTAVNKSLLVKAFLLKYYGSIENNQSIKEPLHTITSKDRFGLVTVHGEDYIITDIRMRMLQPRELYNAQGFPESYIIEGMPKTEQVKKVGNSVCPAIPIALVEANLPELCKNTKREAK